jgi:hypothetical protein
MIAGLPGVGLGGLYYVCLALLIPLRFLFGDKRAHPPRQKRSWRCWRWKVGGCTPWQG